MSTGNASCPVGGERDLTPGEVKLAQSVFGTAIDYDAVTIRRRKWFPFQPRHVTMAPCGHLHFHPKGNAYCADFSSECLTRQGFFIHEMSHVWQTQTRGMWHLIFNRMPWARYDYTLKPGWQLTRYGIEQQAEIIKHAFWLRNGAKVAGVSDASAYDLLVNFPGAGTK
ncbi:vgr related protein [Altererythrobacter sp.]|uniref:vgr related protein n=1 Tax=Altererythrobacter sp. TaxID=1872480 RepID=UPI0025BFC4FA|nr:vgr related protein [Altererythrobacter sp.]